MTHLTKAALGACTRIQGQEGGARLVEENPEIRPATVEDIDGIAGTIVDSARYHHRLDRAPYRIAPVDEVIRELREAREMLARVTLVACIDGNVVAGVDVRSEGPRRVGMGRPRVSATIL